MLVISDQSSPRLPTPPFCNAQHTFFGSQLWGFAFPYPQGHSCCEQHLGGQWIFRLRQAYSLPSW